MFGIEFKGSKWWLEQFGIQWLCAAVFDMQKIRNWFFDYISSLFGKY